MIMLKAEGLPIREIGKRFGLSCEKAHEFFKRYNSKDGNLATEITIKRKGRQPKYCVFHSRTRLQN